MTYADPIVCDYCNALIPSEDVSGEKVECRMCRNMVAVV